MKALNLGCGERTNPHWTNVDVASHPGVQVCDLSRGIPFPDGEFDIVYHSHLLEHFSPSKGQALLRECFRVCRSGRIIRLAVPDLEQIARLYLESLERALSGDIQGMHNHEWMVLEMYDQAVREKSGGNMIDFLRRNPLPNEEFVIKRFGSEARRALREIRAGVIPQRRTRPKLWIKSELARRVRKFRRGSRFLFLRLLMSQKDYKVYRAGLFRGGGETHQWMYDRHSLARALEAAGFSEPKELGAAESRIPGWASFHLDTEPDGSIYKPDSLYMEAIRP